jgi:enoyl-[acyl-carrier protein] reductase/trans-2-enoyl-CoA reductase (NAD+)
MIVEPKVRGFICTTAHPKGCAANVDEQIAYVAAQPDLSKIKNILIIGSSTGYGLATRIVAATACHAATIGVMFERPAAGKRTASAGWYNTVAFEEYAAKEKIYAKSINGDAFSDEIKQQTIDLIKHDMPDCIDLVIYSLASPRRTDPKTGETYQSTLKTTSSTYHEKTVDVITGAISEVSIEPANAEEIANTIKVMGGEDWAFWIDAMLDAGVLAENAQTIAYSYIGPKVTYPIYRQGTIGKAKEHLEATAHEIENKLKKINGQATVSINKAVVTQASSAIPVVPLYAAILFRVMKQHNTHEGCIEQAYRLFKDYICAEQSLPLDDNCFIRIDDLEIDATIQKEVNEIWSQVSSENITDTTDLEGYRDEFYRLFGFGLEGVDYTADVTVEHDIPSLA